MDKNLWEAAFFRYIKPVSCYEKSEMEGDNDMIKVRVQGDIYDLNWMKKILTEDKRWSLVSISDMYPNKGTKNFCRMYADIERVKEKTNKQR